MQVIIIITVFLLIMNLIGFASMGIDKSRAIHHAWRIPEATLFTICVCGGSLGSTLGMFFFRHKTKHWYFKYGFPLILIIHIALLVYIITSGNFIIM